MWRGGHCNRVDTKVTRKHNFCRSLCNSLKQGTCTSLLSRSDGALNEGLFRLHMHSIVLELKDPGTLSKKFVLRECQKTDTQHAQSIWQGIKVCKENAI